MFIKSMPKNIYVHLPFCLKKCSFCAFPVHAIGNQNKHHMQLMEKYLYYLAKEIQFSLVPNIQQKQIQSLYIGGGTPSLFQVNQIQSLLNIFKNKLNLNENSQITIQVNAEDINKIKQFQQIGINRFSVGIQTFDSETLKNLNRYNNFGSQTNIFQKIVKQLKIFRPGNLNIDFILDLNLKQQQMNMLFDFVKQINPQHITLYMLEVIENTYLHKNLKDKRFQNIIQFSKMVHHNYSFFSKYLTSQFHYQHYEISNFAKKQNLIDQNKVSVQSIFRSKHNQNYWKGNSEFAGFGMGASSLISKQRITRPKSLKKYFEFVENLQSCSKIKSNFSQLSKQLQIHDQSSKLTQIQQIITSSIRRKQGVMYIQFDQILNDQQQKKSVIQCLKTQIKIINEQRNNIINMQNLQRGIQLNIPDGFILADQIGWKLTIKIQQLFNKKN